MKKMLALSMILLAFVTANAEETIPQPRGWLNKPKIAFEAKDQLSETSFAEVRVTRLMTAVSRLRNTSAIQLSDKMAQYYAGSMYKSEAGKRPYLVRGLFANYTGRHTLFFRDDTLLVLHESLGKEFDPMFCPLVVNLSSEPKKVAIVVGGDE